jgi:hypothetical protein
MNSDHTFPSAGFGLHSRTPWILFFSIRAHLSCLIPNELIGRSFSNSDRAGLAQPLPRRAGVPSSFRAGGPLPQLAPAATRLGPDSAAPPAGELGTRLPTAAKISPRWWSAVSTSDTSLGPMLPSHRRDRHLQPNPATCITLRTPAVTTWRGRICQRHEKGAAAALPCLLRRVRRRRIQLPCSHG